MNNDIAAELVGDFLKVTNIAGIPLEETSISFEVLPAPHKPPTKLPAGKQAVYVFQHRDETLKVGKVGPNSNARYTSQHYTGSAMSTLAGSLIKCQDGLLAEVNENNKKKWITENTTRINFLLDAAVGANVLSLLEAFMQCCLNPRFEGARG